MTSDDTSLTAGQTTTGVEDETTEESLKMFVGQIPRDWSEVYCRHLLLEFDVRIKEVNVLRDKKTGISRGE